VPAPRRSSVAGYWQYVRRMYTSGLLLSGIIGVFGVAGGLLGFWWRWSLWRLLILSITAGSLISVVAILVDYMIQAPQTGGSSWPLYTLMAVSIFMYTGTPMTIGCMVTFSMKARI
jgi:hypothetical protein